MKILIVGAGASGVAASINIKRIYPKDDVLVIEHSDRPLRKILATGNGRCNLGNAMLDVNKYNHPELMDGYSYKEYVDYVESFGFKTKLLGELLYPYSESAQTVRNQMLKTAEKLGVKFLLNDNFIDYEIDEGLVRVQTKNSSFEVDRLVIATGGKSTAGLGNDGSIYQILKNHHYNLVPLRPGLVPVKTKENTKLLDGVRTKAHVSLLENGKKVFEEDGEVLFKKDGLSGIVIFNASNHISSSDKKYEFVLDILPGINRELLEKHQQILDKHNFLEEYLSPKFVEYFERNFDKEKYVKNLKEMRFIFKDFYDFENSQITIGGVDVKDLKKSGESKLENNVYFIGEVVDMHGPCGGYNLTWAFISALNLMRY